MDYYLGLFTTQVLQDHGQPSKPIGVFDAELYITKSILDNCPDPKGQVKYRIVMALTNCVQTTTVPADKWTFIMNKDMAERLDFPQVMNFGG